VVAAVLTCLLVGRLHDAIAYGLIPVGKVFIPLGFVCLLAESRFGSLKRIFASPPGRGFIGFTCALFLSVPFSYLKSGSLEIAMDWMSQSVPILLIVVASVYSVRDVERLMRMFILVAIISGILVLGGKALVFDGPDGPRTTLAGSYDPNDFALAMCVCAAFCLWAIRDRFRIWRLLGIVGFVLAAYCTIRTYSRGGALAFFSLVIMTLVVARRSIPSWMRLAIVPAVVVGLAFAPANYLDRLKTLTSLNKDYNVTSSTGRKQVWARGIGYFAQRPLTGVGVGQYGKAEGQWGSENSISNLKWSAAHNMWVEVAAEMGLVGIVSLCVMILSSIGLWWRVRKRVPTTEDDFRFQRAVETMAIATSAFVVGTMFLSATLNPLTLFLAAVSVALHGLPQARALSKSVVQRTVATARSRPAAGSPLSSQR
jgi:O-antigen ligase